MSFHQRFLWTRSLALMAGLALFALLLWAPLAGAAPLVASQTKTFDTSSATAAVTFDRFDVALGQLEKIVMSYSASVDGYADLRVNCKRSSTSCSETAAFNLTLTLEPFTLGSISLSGVNTASDTVTCRADAGEDSICSKRMDANLSGFDEATDLPTLDAFDDAGTFMLSFRRSGNSTDPALVGSVTVSYTYSERVAAVSEPGALPMLGTALFMAGLARRRRAQARRNASRRAAAQSA